VRMTIGLSGRILQWFTNLYNLVRSYTVWECWKYSFVNPKILPKSPVRKFWPFRGVFMRHHELVMLLWHIWENLATCKNIDLLFWSDVRCILYSLGMLGYFISPKLYNRDVFLKYRLATRDYRNCVMTLWKNYISRCLHDFVLLLGTSLCF